MVKISSWGRLSQEEHALRVLTDRTRIMPLLTDARKGLAYGMGRSYGDCCLNPGGLLWKTTGLDHFIQFDAQSGRIICEAGTLLRDIQRLTLPHGWLLPVTPGTQLITAGGAVANDVHGKNHHVMGSFGDHVRKLTLLRTDGTVIECSPEHEAGWFAATIGGLGLTGLITEVDIQLRPVAGPWLDTEIIPYDNLEAFFKLADSSEENWEHTVSWIDCLAGEQARGIFMRANPSKENFPAPPAKKKIAVPFTPPFSLVNGLSLRPFNALYYHLNKNKAGISVMHYEPFSYPLDNILEWNRIYGPHGFFQYQAAVPRLSGMHAMQALLAEITRSGEGSFLAVLKTFGNRQSSGMLGFPQPGVTLALDFPNKGDSTLRLLTRLDAIIREAGGRLYPAKDARMPKDLFESGYPRLQEFLPYRDPGISSGMSRRLMGS